MASAKEFEAIVAKAAQEGRKLTHRERLLNPALQAELKRQRQATIEAAERAVETAKAQLEQAEKNLAQAKKENG